ncbi:hypothetical protein, partial [Porphyromonas asaccharolytica]|uniref:hypothetical protein n=1 Tax=Porphyromonas asaccharolytica TaxID=28123 RepID=UPI00248E648A
EGNESRSENFRFPTYSIVKPLICRTAYTLSMLFLETMGTICGVICVALYKKFEFAIKTI